MNPLNTPFGCFSVNVSVHLLSSQSIHSPLGTLKMVQMEDTLKYHFVPF